MKISRLDRVALSALLGFAVWLSLWLFCMVVIDSQVAFLMKTVPIGLFSIGIVSFYYLGYVIFLSFAGNQEKEDDKKMHIKPMSKFKIWWDDAVLMKIIRLWRKISDKITGRKWKKLELAEPEDDLIGEIIKRYHVSHRRANEIFNCEIREMVKSIHAKMSVLTW